MCRRVLTEAALIESMNYPYDHQDLFVEQSTCIQSITAIIYEK